MGVKSCNSQDIQAKNIADFNDYQRSRRTMRLSIGLEQRQVQKQILAPRMIQSMEILQLPLQALEERIEQEMNENPLARNQ